MNDGAVPYHTTDSVLHFGKTPFVYAEKKLFVLLMDFSIAGTQLEKKKDQAISYV